MSMNKKAQEQTARMLEQYATDVRNGKVDWVWCVFKYPTGRITFATKDAPARPRGMS
jgi:hypothetical protein